MDMSFNVMFSVPHSADGFGFNPIGMSRFFFFSHCCNVWQDVFLYLIYYVIIFTLVGVHTYTSFIHEPHRHTYIHTHISTETHACPHTLIYPHKNVDTHTEKYNPWKHM